MRFIFDVASTSERRKRIKKIETKMRILKLKLYVEYVNFSTFAMCVSFVSLINKQFLCASENEMETERRVEWILFILHVTQTLSRLIRLTPIAGHLPRKSLL